MRVLAIIIIIIIIINFINFLETGLQIGIPGFVGNTGNIQLKAAKTAGKRVYKSPSFYCPGQLRL